MGKIDNIGKEMRPVIVELQTSVAEQAESIKKSNLSASITDKKIISLEKKWDKLLEKKITRLEDRACRNNIRILNLPEACEASN